MKHFLIASTCIAAAALGACTGESSLPVATGEGSVRAINAIKTSPAINFLIEERTIASVEYKGATSTASYDDLDYTFNFEVRLAGDTTSTRVASQYLDVVRDTDYTFVVTGDIAAPTITLWETPLPEVDSTTTTFQARFANLDDTLGNVDVYFAAPGTAPVLGEQVGTLAYGDILPAVSLEGGDYALTLTAEGDPGTVVFESDTITLTPATVLLFSTFTPDANELGSVAVRGFNFTSGISVRLPDVNLETTARFFHANYESGLADIYIDDPLTVPFVEDHAFGDITGDLAVPSTTLPITYTAADNVGAILIDNDKTLSRASRNYFYLVRVASGEDVLVDYIPDLRPVETVAKLSLMNTAALDVSLDVYIVPTGEVIDELNPQLPAVPVGLDPVRFTLGEGPRDIYVTPTGEKTLLAGPVPLDVALGDVVDIILYGTGDPSIVDVVILPQP